MRGYLSGTISIAKDEPNGKWRYSNKGCGVMDLMHKNTLIYDISCRFKRSKNTCWRLYCIDAIIGIYGCVKENGDIYKIVRS
ncbi:hypothetical protein NQ318_003905 [Aromia moschata]|uniref:Uncharacterized protein n=1 Tax=Aromia moschata TaxID=1265417 RepID=A0AAV8Z7U5_9CUCU|nr:hypothetical protein NQ318_003905 [Aromia moschata]